MTYTVPAGAFKMGIGMQHQLNTLEVNGRWDEPGVRVRYCTLLIQTETYGPMLWGLGEFQ